jgi:hypothetical protein
MEGWSVTVNPSQGHSVAWIRVSATGWTLLPAVGKGPINAQPPNRNRAESGLPGPSQKAEVL